MYVRSSRPTPRKASGAPDRALQRTYLPELISKYYVPSNPYPQNLAVGATARVQNSPYIPDLRTFFRYGDRFVFRITKGRSESAPSATERACTSATQLTSITKRDT
jgi:hypothetical protein